MVEQSEWMTMAQYAAHLGARSGTVKRWAHEGMPTEHVGAFVRVNVVACDEWLAAHPKRSVAFNRKSVVYFARRTDGCIKIGFTSDVARRMNELRKEHKITTPTLLAVVSGDKRLELLIHKRFDASRVDLEWFTPTPELMALVDLLARGAKAAA